jgi:hypothetical protein
MGKTQLFSRASASRNQRHDRSWRFSEVELATALVRFRSEIGR